MKKNSYSNEEMGKDDYMPGFMEIWKSGDLASLAPGSRLNIGFVLTPDFTLLAFAGLVDALRLASDIGDRSQKNLCRWSIIGPDMQDVKSSCGVKVTPDKVFGDPAEFDYIVVVGGLLKSYPNYNSKAVEFLQRAALSGVPLVGVCTGVFMLAHAGLLKGYRACVHAYHLEEFKSSFPDIKVESKKIIFFDKDRITCAGGVAAIDVAALLIERHCGRERALKIIPHIVVDTIREPGHPQSYMVDDYFVLQEDCVRLAVAEMLKNIEEPITVKEIADSVCVNMRRLERAFHRSFNMNPAKYFRVLRLKYGYWMLAHSTHPITEVAIRCGFSDASHFSRAFKLEFNARPSEIRAKALDSNSSGDQD